MSEESQKYSPGDDGFSDYASAGGGRMKRAVIILVSALLVLLIIGSVGQLAGAGWFGYRQILYGVNEVYLLNMGPEKLVVSVDGREPVEVDPEGARLVEVMGGEVTVQIKDAGGALVEERELSTDNSDALLKLSEDGCLAISDLGAFYGRGGEDMEIVDTLDEEAREYHLNSETLIWPREAFPRSASSGGGPVLWVELVGCALIEEPKFMRGYLDVRLKERLKSAREE